jgi:zinc transport system substrate-binding protein
MQLVPPRNGRPRARVLAVLIALVLWTGPALAAANGPPRVVASIAPVFSLVAAVMQGVGGPTLLVKGGASPHTYSLRPSDATALRRADVIFWVGEDLETFLNKPLATLPAKARIVALSEADGVALLPAREGGVWAPHHHGDEREGGDANGQNTADAGRASRPGDREEHHHGETDMHVWLDPMNAKAMAGAIVATLKDADPAHADAYTANGRKLDARLDRLDEDLQSELSPLAGEPYVVFHDAYHYLEARYGLTPGGSITVTPEHRPGAQTLRAIREAIIARGAMCVFREPQFEPSLVRTLVEGTPARTGVLDPLGADIPPGPDGYFILMQNLANALQTCLGS